MVVAGLCALMAVAPVHAADGLADVILKALPTIGTVLEGLFKPKTDASPTKKQADASNQMKEASDKAMKEVGTYAQREQILSKMVAATVKATTSITTMDYLFSQGALSESQITLLRTQEWQAVKTALDAIAKAAPDSSVFGTDSFQISAINDILDADATTKNQLDQQFNLF